jgi:hypothetical protein
MAKEAPRPQTEADDSALGTTLSETLDAVFELNYGKGPVRARSAYITPTTRLLK